MKSRYHNDQPDLGSESAGLSWNVMSGGPLDEILNKDLASIRASESRRAQEMTQLARVVDSSRGEARRRARSEGASRNILHQMDNRPSIEQFSQILDGLDTRTLTRASSVEEGGQGAGASSMLISKEGLAAEAYGILSKEVISGLDRHRLIQAVSAMLDQLAAMNESQPLDPGYPKAAREIEASAAHVYRIRSSNDAQIAGDDRVILQGIVEMYQAALSLPAGGDLMPLMHSLMGEPRLVRRSGGDYALIAGSPKSTYWQDIAQAIKEDVTTRLDRANEGASHFNGALGNLLFDPLDLSEWKTLGKGVLGVMSAFDTPRSIAASVAKKKEADAAEIKRAGDGAAMRSLAAAARAALENKDASTLANDKAARQEVLAKFIDQVRDKLGLISIYDVVPVSVLGEVWDVPAFFLINSVSDESRPIPPELRAAKEMIDDRAYRETIASFFPNESEESRFLLGVAVVWTLLRLRTPGLFAEYSYPALIESISKMDTTKFRNIMREANRSQQIDRSVATVFAIIEASDLSGGLPVSGLLEKISVSNLPLSSL